MLRILLVVFGLIFAHPGLAQESGSSHMSRDANSIEKQVWDTLLLSELLPTIRDEALTEARTMQQTMFERGGDGRWLDIVGKMHQPKRLEATLRQSLEKELRQVPQPLIDEALAFYEQDLGRRMIALENKARRDMLDAEVEEDALAVFAAAASHQESRVKQIERLIDSADLIEQNVAGGLNAALAFSMGFADGDGYQSAMTEAQILDEAWKQEPLIRAQALGWLEAFLYRAYAPLSDKELEEYIEFAGSASGQALGQVLFASFDRLFAQTSYEMGIAAAQQLQGRAL